uniref:Ubiquinone/menaquinone biosynthesis C-methylase UbiE n=1 Tax=Candidatus Kentrum sp. TUN TaxID=2126343 RepID=A0A450ZCX3_9GAMM|nr:MAG: Ubiquinone/menaquinone biosynthesis C-methylase UbiE [Candidatus Kentron sp. TUN]VFK54019.1 MAG: Ubiquinone/menaquinone biosynthesis C-methylase UbiE [Candidatus Kentron sp. TUN]VFK61046.1 MAG: Ubiquinone/menaquinone biosynthesis C-methylase UbiE [Candidatus Kentron sp. TUN]
MTTSGYTNPLWNRYAHLHASVTDSFKLSLLRESVEYLTGDILDCGCGTAKIAPFLVDRPDVDSYIGVDLAPEMVKVARWMVSQWGRENFVVKESAIEAVEDNYSSIVSIHSYYTWPEPMGVLEHIHRILQPGGSFVLATPNERLDMKRLLRESSKELIAHPDFDKFQCLDLELAGNPKALFADMDTLVEQTRTLGFRVLECHQRHYLGGVNFLVLSK